MTKAAESVPFATPFAGGSLPAGLVEQEQGQIRQRCCFCPTPHVTDGLGPILAGQLVSDGMCQIAADRWNADLDAKYGVQA